MMIWISEVKVNEGDNTSFDFSEALKILESFSKYVFKVLANHTCLVYNPINLNKNANNSCKVVSSCS